MSPISLRPYQEEAVSSIFSFFKENKEGHPLLVAPTGSGKSILIAEFIKRTLSKWPKERMVVVAHKEELLAQNADKLLKIHPSCPLGIYSAGLGIKKVAQITVAGVDSVYKKPEIFGYQSLMLIDEAHLVPKEGDGKYLKLIKGLKKTNPKLRIIGFTATPYRTDSGLLHMGEGAIFSDICYDIEMRRLINEGYLAKLVSKSSKTQADLTGVRTARGDFVESEMSDRMSKVTQAALDEVIRVGTDRKKWIIFAASVKHANEINSYLNSRDICSSVITGDTSSDVRQQSIMEFKTSSSRVLVGCNVLTTGFDAPNIDLVVLLRATKSTGLYVQMVGRGSRIAEGKKDCMVLDYGGNIRRFGPIDALVVKTPKSGDKASFESAPIKFCPECDAAVAIQSKLCPECGFEFPPPQNLTKEAEVASILSDEIKYEVTDIKFKVHRKTDKPNSIMVTYECRGGVPYRTRVPVFEFLCFDHGGYATKKAMEWWRRRSDALPPLSTEEAITRVQELKLPSHITVIKEGKYDRVISIHYEEAQMTKDYEERFMSGLEF